MKHIKAYSAINVALSLFIVISQSSSAEQIARTATLEPAWRAASLPIEIPVADAPQHINLMLPPIPRRKGYSVCIRFAVRLHTEYPAGWNHYLALHLNGKAVAELTATRRPRLLNHSSYFRSTCPTERSVPFISYRFGVPALEVFFMPNFESVDDRVLTEREEGGWYLLEVSDLVRADAPNELQLTNLAIRQYWRGNPPKNLRMVIDHFELGYVRQSDVSALRRQWLVNRKRAKPLLQAHSQKFMVIVPNGGGMQIEFSGDVYFVESAFSYAGDKEIGFNKLTCTERAEGESTWHIVTHTSKSNVLNLSLEGRAYKLTRTIRLQLHRIVIEDEVVNKTGNVIGIITKHQIITPDFPASYRLHGLTDTAHSERRFSENPTVMLAQERTALGLVLENDAMRVHHSGMLEGNSIHVEDKHFGLAPRERRTIRWTLYPITKDDINNSLAHISKQTTYTRFYFAFINAVRRDWNVNSTVDGPFEFVSAQAYQTESEERKLRQLLSRKHIKIFALGPWFEYYSSANMKRDEYKRIIRNAMQVIKSVEPNAICIALLETNLTPVPIEFFKNSLPRDLPYGRAGHSYSFGKPPGVYGLPAPLKANEIIANSPWHDSVMRNADGRYLLDTWYVHSYGGKALNLMVYPTRDNYWHKQMLDKIRFVLDDVGMDGCYIDQFSMAYGMSDRFTFDRWDGYTVDIDEHRGKVTRNYAELAILSASARREWLEEILRRGKIVVANSMPAVMPLQSLHVFRFMETQGYDPFTEPPGRWVMVRGQLASPIGLGYQWGYQLPSASWAGSPKGAKFFIRTLIAQLHYGLLYYYYGTNFPADGKLGGEFGPVNQMFPLTPVELGEGFIIGKERIITCVSGNFIWISEREPRIHYFDEHGREKAPSAKIKRANNVYRVMIELNDWHEIVVID